MTTFGSEQEESVLPNGSRAEHAKACLASRFPRIPSLTAPQLGGCHGTGATPQPVSDLWELSGGRVTAV